MLLVEERATPDGVRSATSMTQVAKKTSALGRMLLLGLGMVLWVAGAMAAMKNLMATVEDPTTTNLVRLAVVTVAVVILPHCLFNRRAK